MWKYVYIDNFIQFFTKTLREIYEKQDHVEYNTDTSVRHSEMNDDIVRTVSNKEDTELQDKEPVR